MSDYSHGAFVELDQERLSRDELVMLGMKEALDKYIAKFSEEGRFNEHPGVRQVMREAAAFMCEDRDAIAVRLTQSAMRTGSGSLHKIGSEN